MIKKILDQSELKEIQHKMRNTRQLFIDIAKSYNISATTLLKILRANNIPTPGKGLRAKLVNESYFENIDTPNKAYFLGFLAADGYINDKGCGQKYLGISIQERDRHILESFKKDIKFEGKVNFRAKRNINWQATCSVTIVSDKLCNDLDKLGVTPRKSFTYTFPNFKQVPEHLILHFIRGLFDGDGCITVNKITNNHRFFIVGTQKTCEGVRDILYGKYGLGSGNVCKRVFKDHRKPGYVYYVTGNKNVKKLYELLYNNAEFSLIRKKEKFSGIILT